MIATRGPNPGTEQIIMKAAIPKTAAAPRPSVFQKEPHRVRLDAKMATPANKKRDNIFSQSRDIREDRGLRQMKTSHNPQTLPHGR